MGELLSYVKNATLKFAVAVIVAVEFEGMNSDVSFH